MEGGTKQSFSPQAPLLFNGCRSGEIFAIDLRCQNQGKGWILECKVKWALESITTNKASGGDGIPVELFQILKDDAMKVLH